MVNEHMRETIEHSDKDQRRDQQNRDRSSQGACHTDMLSRSESRGHANRAAFRAIQRAGWELIYSDAEPAMIA